MTTGLNAATFENLQLGAGLFLKNFNDAAAQSAAELRLLLAAAIEDGGGVIVATRGGGSFQCTPALRGSTAPPCACATGSPRRITFPPCAGWATPAGALC